MYFQKVLKGICGIDDQQAAVMLRREGIKCNWWLKVSTITLPGIQEKLTEDNLDWHLNRYEETDPRTGRPFREDTPFISTTAGTVERDALRARNILYPPFLTALIFATESFSKSGYIFYGYVYTLGKRCIELLEFSEEVRELHVYTGFLPYHAEGEIVSKIYIPSTRLQRVERYDPVKVRNELSAGRSPTPEWSDINPNYCPPEQYTNIRELLV